MKHLLSLLIIAFSPLAFANISGTHLQNFNPTTDGMCFVSVHCAQPLDPGVVNLGVFANYAVNSLPFFRNPAFVTTQKLSEPNDKLLSSDLSLGFGVFQGWDVGVSFPFVLDQDIDDYTQLGTYDETGLTEWKINTKVRLIKEELWSLAVAAAANFDRIGNNPFSGIDSGPTLSADAVFDYKLASNILLGFNTGYRVHDKGSAIAGTGVTPIGDQLTYSAAVAYNFEPWNTTFIGELFGSTPVDDVDLPTDRSGSNLELLLGARYTVAQKVDLHAGITREVYHGLATPDFRVYLGMNWRVGPLASRTTPMIVEPLPTPVPQEPEFIQEPPDEVIVLYSINFDTNKTSMTASSRQKFQLTIENLRKKVPDLRRIVIEGHTDNTGSDSHNLRLSQGRAETVRSMIMQGLNLDSQRVQAIGRGESNPVVSNDTVAGRAKNRRVELKIYRHKK